jgi:hypothetical protein
MNHLRTILAGRGENEQSQGQALDEYERVGHDGGTITSLTSSINHLANRGRGEGGQPLQGQLLGQPQRGGEQYWGDPAGAGQQGGIPAEIQNMGLDNDDGHSQVTNSILGLGGAEGNQGERGVNSNGRAATGGGIAAKIATIKTRNDDALVERELEWQAKVKGNNQLAAAFKQQTINQNLFRAFAFMKGKSPAVHMVHSIGQFFGLSGLAVNVQGKCIGFIGDRGNGKYPVPIILPQNNVWSWTNVNYLKNTAAFTRYYDDGGNKDKLWNTGVDNAGRLETIELPRMLALPTCVAEFVTAQKGGCLPHMIRKFVKDKIDGGETQVQGHKWLLIFDWCVAASQEKDGRSILQLGKPNRRYVRTANSLTGANNAYYQHSGRNTGKRGNPNKVGEGGTYSWSNKSQTTWNGVSWRGYKPSRQPLLAQRANWEPAKRGATTSAAGYIRKTTSQHSKDTAASWTQC